MEGGPFCWQAIQVQPCKSLPTSDKTIDHVSDRGPIRLTREPTEPPTPASAGRSARGSCRYWVYLRVGSDHSKAPLWAQLPAVIHRQPPAGARIKWAYLHRRMVAERPQWKLTFSLAVADGFPLPADLASGGACGIDLGWRVLTGRELRVGYWSGDDGRAGEIKLPGAILRGFDKVDSIAGHRDEIFNVVKAELSPAPGRAPRPVARLAVGGDPGAGPMAFQAAAGPAAAPLAARRPALLRPCAGRRRRSGLAGAGSPTAGRQRAAPAAAQPVAVDGAPVLAPPRRPPVRL